jgi:oligoendopeptidase F
MAKKRQDVLPQDTWNVDALYPSFEAFQKEFKTLAPQKSPRWPEQQVYQGRLQESAELLKQILDDLLTLDRKLTKLYTYAHLRHDEDITENQAKSAYGEVVLALNDFREETAWFEPELLALPEATIKSYLNSPHLKEYKFYLEKIFRMKPHTLSKEQELLLAMSGKALSATQKAFSAINDADMKFGVVLDSNGQEFELTHAKYGLYLRSQDRTLRENTFKKYHGSFKSFENTLCELLSGQVEAHVFNSKARGFKSALNAALFPRNVDTSVYHALIQAVHEEIDALHEYVALRKDILNLKEIHLYDLQVPLVENYDMLIPYEEAETLVIDSVAPLGAKYQEILKKGLQEGRWVDRFENQNKRSGAYSSGCFDSMPYILMNYKDIIRDVFTLAHEAGHSMHSYLSNKNQPYHYSGYSIFVAEVASTFNEELLMKAMLSRAKNDEEKIFLLTQKIEDIRATLFRQTQFAEFELLIHTLAEKNIPLTPSLLNVEYRKLNEFYYGKDIVIDPEVEIEWARIPHFYYNFYVYQYATGISAALALSEKVLNGGAKEQRDYLQFLESGDSRFPLDVLNSAGVDMKSVEPVKLAIGKFRLLLKALKELAVKCAKC